MKTNSDVAKVYNIFRAPPRDKWVIQEKWTDHRVTFYFDTKREALQFAEHLLKGG